MTITFTRNRHGIRVSANSNDNRLINNTTDRNDRQGILVNGGSADNEVRKNEVSQNKRHGIRFSGGAENNLIIENESSKNHLFDLSDVTEGARTAGTAYTYVENECDTSSPAGLCE